MVSRLIPYAILVLGAVGVAVYAVAAYNHLLQRARNIEEAFAGLEATLARRHEEIPKLVDVCLRYMAHEKAVLERLARLPSEFEGAPDLDFKIGAENALTRDLSRVLSVAGAYPELKANEDFQSIETRLTALENQLAPGRERFNEAVMSYNAFIAGFPALPWAWTFGLRARPTLEIGAGHDRRRLAFAR